ncbi:M3 family oligoendopeptidase [Paremcibacter congregatus]|uniref:Oligoendopeptidase F n=1 Tax=Paremcibacter congregatus TaxID=2043170 RepID=A0A2G4YVB4_9PROT|nr:M3 family oligoendopeptidase [Paremcibacter congregatus]PHZ86180.1 oligoendopeptidase F [Paremcibacter congregatus]QDE27144.1 M3 family oligoendopeptidase [Paremcibacter congregatus]
MTIQPTLNHDLLPTWDLSDLYPSMTCPELKNDFSTLEQKVGDFSALHKGKLATLTAPEMLDVIKKYEVMEETMGRIMSYAGLLHAGDVMDADISKFYQSCHERLTELSTKVLFLTLEINQIDDKILEHWFQDSADLKRYRPWFDSVRLYRPHQLDEKLEELLMEKSVSGSAAWVRLFDETMADLKFDYTDPKTQETTIIGSEEALNYLSDKQAPVRKAAAACLSKTFAKNIRLFSHITNTLAKDKQIEDSWRHYTAPSASRHLSNQVEKEVVDALVSAVKAAYPKLSHRYYKMKAGWFGQDTLDWWDRNAPLPDSDDLLYQWPDAQKTVLDAYRRFSPELADIGTKFFDNAWIDAPVREGKSPGAFAHPTVPGAHPYLLLNYLGKTRDVMTLAHELGHGVHQVLAGPQGQLLADTPLTLAETASVFGEMLTFQSLLNDAPDDRQRKNMIAAKVEDMLNTVVRQIAFYDFEERVHAARKESELSADDLGDIWMAVQQESLGDGIAFDDSYRTFWCYIPHFIHSPFYVYAYAFGDCLVNSLYATYQNSPDGFQQKYMDMLRAGGSLRHKELLSPFGLDASAPDFWATGLNMISDMIDQLE